MDKSQQRIKFGKNGIKDGNGKVIRTDHPTWYDIIDGSPTREKLIDKYVDDAVDGKVSGLDKMKALQDEYAGNVRRKA